VAHPIMKRFYENSDWVMTFEMALAWMWRLCCRGSATHQQFFSLGKRHSAFESLASNEVEDNSVSYESGVFSLDELVWGPWFL